MSPPELASLDRAITVARALGRAVSLGEETVGLADACGRTVAVAAIAEHELPGFCSSAMDGFAVRAADLTAATDDAPVTLAIVAESRAGEPTTVTLADGQAVRIATGAVVPSGADAVVPYEDVEQDGDRVRIAAPTETGRFLRPPGTDVAVGDALTTVGTVIQPHHLAPLAGAGFGSLVVRRRPRVSVLLTGDEVVRGAGPHVALAPGAVHDVNGVVVPALLRSWGAEVVEVVHLPDDRAATIAALAATRGELVVVCGGLSMGPHDHVRPALEALGARQDLFRISLQPGKPTWMGALVGGHGTATGEDRPVFGLPGNPASVFATATLLVREALAAARGELPAGRLRARLTDAAPARAQRLGAMRARVHADAAGRLAVEILTGQASHLLGSLAHANALALIPPGRGRAAGTLVEVVPLDPAACGAAPPYDPSGR